MLGQEHLLGLRGHRGVLAALQYVVDALTGLALRSGPPHCIITEVALWCVSSWYRIVQACL